MLAAISRFFIRLTRNPLSLAGSAITTASALIMISLIALEIMGLEGGPYMGILAFLVLPGIFLIGLVLIPVGLARERRRARKAAEKGGAAAPFPIIDLNRERTRKVVLIFFALTLANIVILAAATYKGVHVMESTSFCGETCHTVMQPEFTAYQRSPHARVACVDCHIGPGAPWFVKSKLSGAWQVVAATFNLYPQPVPTPIENLRPARETCEQCHWPTIFVGDRLKLITHFADDEENTELKTVLLLRVGGVEGRTSHGIHWHVDPGNRIRYRSDPTRETVYEVELTEADGTVTTFAPSDAPPDDGTEATQWRTMDCVDCHNRPSHTFRTRAREVDDAIADDRIDRSLPYVREQGLELLTAEYPSHEAAADGIREALLGYYRESYPEVAETRGPAIEAAAAALTEAYASNVFPAMNVTWGTYPNHIGHEETPGCFRCHDEEHSTEDGETISQDCDTCHSILAWEEEDPEILGELNP